MAIEIETEIKPLFDVQINQQRLEELLQRGRFSNHVKNDIAIKAWATTFNPNGLFDSFYSFDSPFIRLGRSEKDLSYAEKVAQSIKMLDIALDGVSTGRDSYGPRDYITSDFDFVMDYTVEGIVEDIQMHLNSPLYGIRVNNEVMTNFAPFFLLFNFDPEKSSTALYCRKPNNDKQVELVRMFDDKTTYDMIIPFSILPAFPVYNVTKIVVVDYDDVGAVEYSAKGAEDVFLFPNFFSR